MNKKNKYLLAAILKPIFVIEIIIISFWIIDSNGPINIFNNNIDILETKIPTLEGPKTITQYLESFQTLKQKDKNPI